MIRPSPQKLTELQVQALAAVGAGKVKGRLDAFSHWKRRIFGVKVRSLNSLIVKGLVEEVEDDEPGITDTLRYSLTEAGRAALETLTRAPAAREEHRHAVREVSKAQEVQP